MAKTLHFKNKEAYNKWVAHVKIHGESSHGKPKPAVKIAGKTHKVKRDK